MKKFIMIVLALLLLLMSCTFTFAASEYGEESQGASSRFASVFLVVRNIHIRESYAYPNVTITPKSSTPPDKVEIDVELMRIGSSAPIASWSQTLSKDEGGIYYFGERKKLSLKGTYYLSSVVRCYRGGRLVDTITGDSGTATY